jgi:hypothetical protein
VWQCKLAQRPCAAKETDVRDALAGSHRSFTAYIFRRVVPDSISYSGPESALLSSFLAAPRTLQVTLPRLLRSRNKSSSKAEHKPVTMLAAAEKHVQANEEHIATAPEDNGLSQQVPCAAVKVKRPGAIGHRATQVAHSEQVQDRSTIAHGTDAPRLVIRRGRLIVRNLPLRQSFGRAAASSEKRAAVGIKHTAPLVQANNAD